MDISKSSLSSKLSLKPSISSIDNSKRIDDSIENYSLFEVNYDGMFNELPLRYAYGKVLPLKLSNSNRMTYSEILDMLVYKLECEIRALFYSIPRNSYEDVYSGGCFDVSGSFKGFDCIEEPVGCDNGSLPVKIKEEFENEVILDDVVSSPLILSMLSKRKGKSRVKFTRMRGIIKRSKMVSLRMRVRTNY
ncbi:hypothetical protein Tco_1275730 [Tanacetum coccineum]